MRIKLLLVVILCVATLLSLGTSVAVAETSESFVGDVGKVRELFLNKRFQELSALLQKYMVSSEQDIRWEFAVSEGFQVFNVDMQSSQDLLDEWVRSDAKNYISLLARASYFSNLGWNARGTKWAKDTSQEQFSRMEDYFTFAVRDVNAALEINPRLAYAYYIMIGINQSSGNQTAGALLVKKALELSPSSYIIRRRHMWLLRPRWGGSYEDMSQFAQEAAPYAEKHPLLKTLNGYVYWDQAEIARSEKNIQKAIELYKKALTYGENWDFLSSLAENYYYQGKNDEAIGLIDQAIAMRPNLGDGYLIRALILTAQGRNAEAVRDIEKLERSVPNSYSSLASRREWESGRIMKVGHALFKTDLTQAIEKYTLAVRLFPENADAYCWRGVCYNRTGSKDAALADLRKAITLNPRLYRAYCELDAVLFGQGRLDEIIELWTKFLDLEPDNADAYLQRSGTFYHKKDFASSRRDAAKACELGNTQACQRMNSIPK